MKNYLQRRLPILSYYMDFEKKLSLPACMGMFQDIANDHGEKLGVDRWSLLKSSNAFWVITKVKMKIKRFPELDQKVDVKTWTIDNTAVKFDRDCTISIVGEELVAIKSEWVALDATTRRIRPAKTIKFPFDMKNIKKRAISEKYSAFSTIVDSNDFVYERKVVSTDIDVNNHVNNCFYSRFVLDCFSVDFLRNHQLTDYEIHFINESTEGETIAFYKKEIAKNVFYVEARVGEKVITKTQLKFQ